MEAQPQIGHKQGVEPKPGLRRMVACSYPTRAVCPALLPGEGRNLAGTQGTFPSIRDTREVFTQNWENLLIANTPFPEQP